MTNEYTTPFDRSLVPAEPASRIPLEMECIHLLCRFDQLLVSLDETEGVPHLIQAVQVARELLQELVQFEVAQFGPTVLLNERRWIQFFQEQLQQTEQRIRNHPWRGFAEAPVELPESLMADYRLLGEEYVNLLSHLFGLIEPWYHSPHMARQWNASCQMFVTEFLKRW